MAMAYNDMAMLTFTDILRKVTHGTFLKRPYFSLQRGYWQRGRGCGILFPAKTNTESERTMSERIKLEGLPNTRDLGGMVGADGRKIAKGKLIRSGQLYSATQADIAYLSGCVDLVADFRTDRERQEKPNPVLPGAEMLHIPIFESLTAGISRDKESDKAALAMVGKDPEKARQYMANIYLGFVTSDFSIGQYRRFIRLLLKRKEKATLWHCTAGKDRAGFAAVLVQTLLGVDRAAIMEDYLRTNDYLGGELASMAETASRLMGNLDGNSDQALHFLFGAHEDYLAAVYDKADELYGGLEQYISDGLGISAEERALFRSLYLEG